jgi:molybdenum cofactor guanylyltransferase
MDYSPTLSITGVILAGGRAQRMGGQDKGLLSLAGQPMISYAIRRLKPQVERLLINANRNLEAYQALGYPLVSDSIGQFLGPLAGMLAAMTVADTPYLLTLPCDCPLLRSDYARRMRAELIRHDADISVAHDGQRLQPVFALLRTDLQDSLKIYLESGQRKIDLWFARHRRVEVDFSDHQGMFRNINTPQDLTLLEAEINRAG